MPARPAILVLLALSLAANGAIGFRLLRPASPDVDSPSASATPPAADHSPADATPSSSGVAAPADATWTRLASRDPAELAARLRAAGFSSAAARGAVHALMRELEEAEFVRLQAEAPLAPFWDARQTVAARNAAADIARRFRRERLRQSRELFPEDQMEFRLRHQVMYGQLSDEKLNALAAIDEDYAELRRKAQESSLGGPTMPWQRDELALLEAERLKDVAALLDPAELEEFNLRNSPVARGLQRQLAAFNPTEQEFRDIYAIQARFHSVLSTAPARTPSAAAERAQYQREMEQALQELLGPERYAEYRMSSDSGFQAAQAVVQQFGLPPLAAHTAYQIQQEVSQRASALRSERGRAPAERSQAMAELVAEARRRLAETLTDEGLEQYRRRASWLRLLELQAAQRPPGP